MATLVGTAAGSRESQDSIRTGFPPAAPLLLLAAYTLVFAFLARRFFRWE